ncbi:class I SAM-dependent methyltransferase [Microbacterium sp. HD4P20]|uniref:class I SAM-dependent methyltransferase n=1 Tax=Microbacterium sp. HD4P20 TaxID=2864874 RepID=UPI001C64145C|nr:class I SAM-dependent methyltransferase [Microbacterium sp. HD4P20]MCP2636259.1 class I SAM-dependent methyltransferase [Microbacterium sp. HD4P20]
MSFDVAAEAYDAFMGRFSVPLAELFADEARLPHEGRALDVGCGTGALTGVLAHRFGETEVAGVDPSASFVDAAAARFPWADLRHGTAEALPFDDDVFAATLAELVVHFMTDATAGAREMVRVTRPGGVVAACVWDFARGRAPQSRFFEALRAVKADIDDESERFGAREHDLTTLLQDAGCLDVTGSELTVSVPFADFAEWWAPYTRGVSPAGAQLAALPPEDRERVRRHAHAAMGDGPFTVVATAWAARGIAP